MQIHLPRKTGSKALDLRNWEATVRLVREWQIHAPKGTLSVSDACDKFISDAKDERLNKC